MSSGEERREEEEDPLTLKVTVHCNCESESLLNVDNNATLSSPSHSFDDDRE